MPVSRTRKKKPPRPKSVQQGRKLRERRAEERGFADLERSFGELGSYRAGLERDRAEKAAEQAAERLPELLALVDGRGAAQAEDALCAYLGSWIHGAAEFDEDEPADYLGPDHILAAAIGTAAGAVRAELSSGGAGPDQARAPWLLLETLAAVAPDPYDASARHELELVRRRPGGDRLPEPLPGPTVAEPVLWTRDAYGGRYAVTARFHTRGGDERWYLWDVDCCNGQAFTVYSGYFADAEAALAAWKDGVGAVAADGCVFTPVGDEESGTLSELLPADLGMMNPGGEDEAQFAELHRSRRLADEVRAALPEGDAEGAVEGNDAESEKDPEEVAECVRLFSARLAESRPEAVPADAVGEVVDILVHDWFRVEFGAAARVCSPHRVALFAQGMADYYQDEFAQRLLAVLPEWLAWFAERSGLAARLADRSAPYAAGAVHSVMGVGRDFNMLARVEE